MKQNPSYVLKELADVPYLLPYGQMIADHKRGMKINETGKFFWNLLTTSKSIDELLTLGKEHFEVETENYNEFEKDVRSFLNTLLSHNILLEDNHTNNIQTFDRKTVCVAGLYLNLVNFYTAFPEEFTAFLTEERMDADQIITFYATHPYLLENGKVILRNYELNIMELEDKYIFNLPLAKDLHEIHLSKDGSKVDIYGVPTLSDTFKYDLFHALRLPFLYLAQKHHMVALHSVSVLYKDKAWLFSGSSGTGKSTHAALWQKYLNVPTINGDLNLLAFRDGTPVIHGIPWCGTSDIFDTNTHELGGIVLLKQAPGDFIKELTEDEKILLVSQRLISPNWTMELFENNMTFVEKLISKIMTCRLYCTKEQSALEVMQEHIDIYLKDA